MCEIMYGIKVILAIAFICGKYNMSTNTSVCNKAN